MKNRDLFLKDPAQNRLLNDGVVTVTDAMDEQAWKTLRFELEHFVCEGQYAQGLKRILEAFLRNLGGTRQQAAWVSGFFGSGKSHTLKMLRHLWVDTEFPDGSTARNLAVLPVEINDLLKEITTMGKRHGGLHAASGTLASGSGDNVRLAVLNILLRSKDLPGEVPQARFYLWLKNEGLLEQFSAALAARGRQLMEELKHLYVSPPLAESLLEIIPGFAPDLKSVRDTLKKQFPLANDVSPEEFNGLVKEALAEKGNMPCTLIVLDEIQLFIGQDDNRSYAVQLLAENLCSQFQSRVLLIGSGQTALYSAIPMVQRLKDRFTIPVELADTDVETVTRKVVLAKRADARKSIEGVAQANQGEIARHLNGTKIGSRNEDDGFFVEDYPLLPVRRRFWEKILRAIDQKGFNNQVRTQLKIVYDAVAGNADNELGQVVPADFLYESQETQMRQSNILFPELYELISKLDDGSPEGRLSRRLCGLIFLIRQLPREAAVDIGVRATPEMLADLLVSDLEKDGVDLRRRIPELLEKLCAGGKLIRIGDEYRMQTKASAEWEKEYRQRQTALSNDPHKVASRVTQRINDACRDEVNAVKSLQGKARVPRELVQHTGQESPSEDGKSIPIWIRDGWSSSQGAVLEEARRAGTGSPVLHVFVDNQGVSGDLKKMLIEWEAAENTLGFKGPQASDEGKEAQAAMETRRENAEGRIREMLRELLANARVYRGGGKDCAGMFLKEKLQDGVESSLARLFPRFEEGDGDKWGRVVDLIKQGSEEALKITGHEEAPERHPVCAEVLRQVGGASVAGKTLRESLKSSPCGWSQDAVDGAIMLLHLTGHLRATYKGALLRQRELDHNKISLSEFRAEKVQLDTRAKLSLRRAYQNAGLPCQPGQEIEKADEYIRLLEGLRQQAGGEPPLPERGDAPFLKQLMEQSGADLAQAMLSQLEALDKAREQWKAKGELAIQRLQSWEALKKLKKFAAPTPVVLDLFKQADAICHERRLLEAADPVGPLRKEFTDILRDALNRAYGQCAQVFEDETQTLEQDPAWKALGEEPKDQLYRDLSLVKPPKPAVGGEAELLGSLEKQSLEHWNTLAFALSQQFARAKVEAARILKPKARSLRLPRATVSDETELKAYLSKLEMMLKKGLENGPIILE